MAPHDARGPGHRLRHSGRLLQQLRRHLRLRRRASRAAEPAPAAHLAADRVHERSGRLDAVRASRGQPVVRDRLRPRRPGRPGDVSRNEPRDSPRRRAAAVRCRPPHAAFGADAGEIRRRVHAARGRRGAPLGASSRSDGIGDLHRPAGRVADGALLPRDALLCHPRARRPAEADVGSARRELLCAGHGHEGGDGHGAADGDDLGLAVRAGAGPIAPDALRRTWRLLARPRAAAGRRAAVVLGGVRVRGVAVVALSPDAGRRGGALLYG